MPTVANKEDMQKVKRELNHQPNVKYNVQKVEKFMTHAKCPAKQTCWYKWSAGGGKTNQPTEDYTQDSI